MENDYKLTEKEKVAAVKLRDEFEKVRNANGEFIREHRLVPDILNETILAAFAFGMAGSRLNLGRLTDDLDDDKENLADRGPKHGIEISVNGEKHTVPDDFVTYDEIKYLAGVTGDVMTITFKREGHDGGALVPGDKVKATSGTNFTVTSTDGA